MSLLGDFKKGQIFIVSAPAGAGKTTLVRLLTAEFSKIKQSVSFTTRERRGDEEPGVDYQYISEGEFKEKIAANEFLEYAKVHGHYYGTSRTWVEGELKKGNHVILVIDTQGAIELMKKIKAISIFIKPPSIEVLKERLLLRQTDSLAEIERRLQWAETELKAMSFYDYVIVNEDLAEAYQVLKSVMIAEGHKQNLGEVDHG